MSSRIEITRYTGSFSDNLARLREAMDNAEAVVIGAGAGLSTSAGFIYTGERFEQYFSDFIEKYGFTDMYSGGFHRFESPEEHWAYWSRYIFCNRYMDPPKPVYENLLSLIHDKNYFVLTTNVDHCFQKAGFDKERLFYTQGDYGLLQCSVPCHHDTYDNEDLIRKMVEQQNDMRVPTELLPKCPECGKPMTMNLRADHRFVEDAGWIVSCGRYEDFIKANLNKRILFFELGVGFNTPGIIKYPFWQMTADNPDAVFASINKGESWCPVNIQSQSVCLDGDIGEILDQLNQ